MSAEQKSVEIYTTSTCPFCVRAKQLLDSKSIKYKEISLDGDNERAGLIAKTGGMRTVPQIFVNNELLVGGCDGLYARESNGELESIFFN